MIRLEVSLEERKVVAISRKSPYIFDLEITSKTRILLTGEYFQLGKQSKKAQAKLEDTIFPLRSKAAYRLT